MTALGAPRRRQVFTHSSWASSRERSYERLEFLGDSVLEVVVSEELMRRHPDVAEGDLSWMRQAVVGRDSCAAAADAGGLPEAFVAAAPAGRRDAARELAGRTTVRAALAEAAIGAGWLDLGAEQVREAVLEAFGPAIDAAVPGERDPKTSLQERAARSRLAVVYELVDTAGPPQRRTFTTRVRVGDEVLGTGSGSSKQASERAAAVEALARLAAEAAQEAGAC